VGAGFMEFIVGFATEVPVGSANNEVWVAQVAFIKLAPGDDIAVTLGPPSVPTIPNSMTFVYVDPVNGSTAKEIWPSSGSFDEPVFYFGETVPTATEDASFGSVKALFR
jgi:hypothetical protein